MIRVLKTVWIHLFKTTIGRGVEGESGSGEVYQFWMKFTSFGEVYQFCMGDTFLDRSRSSVGVGSSFFDMFQV